MESEPSWTQKISNNTVCSFFYVFAMVYLTLGIVSLLGLVYGFVLSKIKVPGIVLFMYILTSGISFTTALFHYLICKRALDKPSA